MEGVVSAKGNQSTEEEEEAFSLGGSGSALHRGGGGLQEKQAGGRKNPKLHSGHVPFEVERWGSEPAPWGNVRSGSSPQQLSAPKGYLFL